MATDQAINAGSTSGVRARNPQWRRPLAVAVSLTAVVAFLGWIAAVALTLPTRYLANHWNVAWVGFDVMLLISLLMAGWAVATRRPWAGTALIVNAVLLTCDAWFDVTTASGGTAIIVSIGLAVGVELPAAAGLAWAAMHSPARGAGLIRTHPQPGAQSPRSLERNGPL